MSRPVVWFEVVGQSQETLRDFYGSLFGWQLNFDNPMKYAMVPSGGEGTVPGGVGAYSAEQLGEGASSRGWTTFYVSVESVAVSLEQAVALGGRVMMPAHTMGDGTVIGMFSDPEGHPIGVITLVSPQPAAQT